MWQVFDVCIEASGSSGGIEVALALTRPLGTVVLKSTCSLNDPHMPQWSAVANDIVVNEKRLFGSRCGQLLLDTHELKQCIRDGMLLWPF